MKKHKQPRSPAETNSHADRTGAKPSRFAQSLLHEWKKLELPVANECVVVAVSGGADSVALLLAIDELIKSGRLKTKVQVAHLNHKLRGKMSDADARSVAALAKALHFQTEMGSVDVKRIAAKTGDNLEQAARRARYEFLAKTANKRRAGVVLTAHTMDDQAETVLMNLLRGSGGDGLAGVEPVRAISAGSVTLLARPLLSWARRKDTENFCRLRGVDFCVDEMNTDEKFARVRVRQQLLPLMATFNPKVVEGLTRTAELLREDSLALDRAAARLLELSIDEDGAIEERKTTPSLRLDLLSLAQPALRRRALRLWIGQCRGDLKRLERVHVVAVESLLFGERGGRVVELPGGARISRSRGLLRYGT